MTFFTVEIVSYFDYKNPQLSWNFITKIFYKKSLYVWIEATVIQQKWNIARFLAIHLCPLRVK